ncbi:hypothetical protein [Longispora fulva]|uniref:Tetratricopeptide (TPR) repeat protein n=1 Tax=Longispora fulva TaxID=619741 RepID=A0A8J7GVF7_9ACTN|nr:hypothetical protein [Longispora fulva]MBG6140255.1 tetratricopeptide (TPR) repeat protein [Longispora fulva]
MKSQLRFRNAWHVLGELRPFAWRITDLYPDGLSVAVRGELNDADSAAFAVIGKHAPLVVEWSPKRAVTLRGEYRDAATESVDADRRWLETAVDWEEVQPVIGRYLACGDSWSAVWLIEAALSRFTSVTEDAADMIGLAYQMAGRTETSETYRKIATMAGGLRGARAYTGLAMLFARQHPPALRSMSYAAGLLEIGWSNLAELPAADLDRALNRNAMAYVLMRSQRKPEAIALLVDALPLVEGDPLASAILHNNLGRLYSVSGEPQKAEFHLGCATRLDPLLPEHHLDLAHFLARAGRHSEALAAARRAEKLTASIPAVPALVGYLHSSLGKPSQAAAAYERAHRIDPDDDGYLIAAAREACDAGKGRTASRWLSRVDFEDLTPAQQAEVELLQLWAGTLTGDVSPTAAGQALVLLGKRYPDSDLIRQNLEASAPEPVEDPLRP